MQLHEHPRERYSPTTSRRTTLESFRLWRTVHTWRRADALLFSSNWTRLIFERLEGIPTLAHQVVPLSGWPDDAIAAAPDDSPLPEVIMMAEADRRDALQWGLDAWRAAGLGDGWKLVIVGNAPNGPLPKEATTTGWLSDEELRDRSSHASADAASVKWKVSVSPS